MTPHSLTYIWLELKLKRGLLFQNIKTHRDYGHHNVLGLKLKFNPLKIT